MLDVSISQVFSLGLHFVFNILFLTEDGLRLIRNVSE